MASSFRGIAPKRKKKKRKRHHVDTAMSLGPFPVPIASLTGLRPTCLTWHHYTGCLSTDCCVTVEDSYDMTALYEMGFFGKGSLSRSRPEYNCGLHNKRLSSEKILQVVSKRRYLRHLMWRQTSDGLDSNNVDTLPASDKPSCTPEPNNLNPDSISCPSSPCEDESLQETKLDDDTVDEGHDRYDHWAEDDEETSAAFWNSTSTDDCDDVMKSSDEHCSSSERTDVTTGGSGDTEMDVKTDDRHDVPSTSACQTSSQDVGIPPEAALNRHPECLQAEEDGDWLVIDDVVIDSVRKNTDEHCWCPVIKRDPYPLNETLQLSAEEAFFLSYGLGCLTVFDRHQNPLNLTQMWRRFCSQPRFVERYIAYHYLRGRGWVPKTGLKYGADFLIYKDGPDTFHSSYSVTVRLINENGQQITADDRRPMTWAALAGLNRITEQVCKRILFVYVVRPYDLTLDDCLSPACICRFTVQEVFLERWVSAHERENT